MDVGNGACRSAFPGGRARPRPEAADPTASKHLDSGSRPSHDAVVHSGPEERHAEGNRETPQRREGPEAASVKDDGSFELAVAGTFEHVFGHLGRLGLPASPAWHANEVRPVKIGDATTLRQSSEKALLVVES